MQQPIASIGGMLVHIVRVAFFLKKQERISRGEYILGVGILRLVFLIFVALWMLAFIAFVEIRLMPIDYRLFPYIHFITDKGFIIILIVSGLMVLPSYINLMIKRLHDIDLPGRRLFFPSPMSILRLWISRYIVRGSVGSNSYGDDPLQHILQAQFYYGKASILIILSMIVCIVPIVILADRFGRDIYHITQEYYAIIAKEDLFCRQKYAIPDDYLSYGDAALGDDSDIFGYFDCTDDDVLESYY